MNNTEQRRSLSWFVYFMIMVFVFLAGTFSSSAQIKDIFKYSTFYSPYLPVLKQTNDGIFQLSSQLIYRNYPAFIPLCLPREITASVSPTTLLLAA